MADIDHQEVVRRLKWLATSKPGDELPDWLPPIGWHAALAETARAALNFIEPGWDNDQPKLRTEIE